MPKAAPPTEPEVIDETAASDSIKAHTSASKSSILKDLLSKVAGMSIEDLSHWHNDAIALIGHEADKIPGGAASKNAASIKAKGGVKEDVEALFAGEDELSEEFREKTATLFEAALEARMIVERQEMEEEFDARLVEEVEKIHTEVTEQVNSYLDFGVKAWAEDNIVAIESSLRNESTMEFIEGLKKLFTEHYIEVPEDKVDVVEALQEKVTALEEQNNDLILKLAEKTEEETEAGREEVVAAVTEGMVLADAERLKTLTENLDFDGDAEAFRAKLVTVKEHYFNKAPVAPTGLLSETFEEEEVTEDKTTVTTSTDPNVARYVKAASKYAAANR